MSSYSYAGTELDLFAAAITWKSYWRDQIKPFVNGDVLEVGAGNGNNTEFLRPLSSGRWVSLEPDRRLAETLQARVHSRDPVEVVVGTTAELPQHDRFDTILYVDVLEHIEDDRGELRAATERLRDGGHLLVLAPAHQWLYTPFDAAIGHVRRYDRRSLARAAPPGLHEVFVRYLDAFGILASAGNRLVLRHSRPTAAQLHFWDRYLVPCSVVLDRLLAYHVGKSILGVWQRTR